jgi:hypothetical protein
MAEQQDVEQYEHELAEYLQERIKPGLNSGAIPLLARSIAKDIAHRERPNGSASQGESEGKSGDEQQSQNGGGSSDFEADMHDFQEELGKDWILRFSVHGEEAWLTAETEDGSQRVEAPTAEVLSDAVAALNKGGGRSS